MGYGFCGGPGAEGRWPYPCLYYRLYAGRPARKQLGPAPMPLNRAPTATQWAWLTPLLQLSGRGSLPYCYSVGMAHSPTATQWAWLTPLLLLSGRGSLPYCYSVGMAHSPTATQWAWLTPLLLLLGSAHHGGNTEAGGPSGPLQRTPTATTAGHHSPWGRP